MPGLFWALTKIGLARRPATWASWLLFAIIVIAIAAGLWARGDHYRAKAIEAERDADRRMTAQIDKYHAAYRDAFERAWTDKLAQETRDRAAKEKADEDYIDELESGLARANAYAASNRCVRTEDRADPGSGSRAGVPRPAAAPAQPDSTTGAAELVGITRRDFDLCTAAGLRLGNAHIWAQDYPAPIDSRATD